MVIDLQFTQNTGDWIKAFVLCLAGATLLGIGFAGLATLLAVMRTTVREGQGAHE